MSGQVSVDPTAVVATDADIRALAFIGPNARVGAGAVVGEGAHIGPGCLLEDDVRVGPGAVLLAAPDGSLTVHVSKGATIGGGAVLAAGVRVHRGARVADGAVVARDVPAHAVVAGHPAQITGYVDSPVSVTTRGPAEDGLEHVVAGVSLWPLTHAVDLRGSLVAANFDAGLPFVPRRVFAVFDVPSRDVRGEHAHRRCEQFLIALRGSITCVVSDGRRTQQFVLDRPDVGLHMPPMLWGTQYDYSPDAVLLVLASDEYDPDDYIRTYDEFLREAGVDG